MGARLSPEYIGLSVISERFPKVPRIALTATADDLTRREIVRSAWACRRAEFSLRVSIAEYQV